MIQGLVGKQHRVFDEDGAGSQDEGREQVDVDVVSGAAELPAWQQQNKQSLLLAQALHANSNFMRQREEKKVNNLDEFACVTL